MECCVGRRSSRVLGSERSWTRIEWQWIVPALTGRGEVPTLLCVYSDTVVVVIALAEVAAPSSSDCYLLYYVISQLFDEKWDESSYDAHLTDEEAAGWWPVLVPRPVRGCAWEADQAHPWPLGYLATSCFGKGAPLCLSRFSPALHAHVFYTVEGEMLVVWN